jgi:hypothetical protein
MAEASPPGGSWSVYNPPPGTDPVWDAYLAEFTARVANRNAAAELRKRRVQADADAVLASIDFNAPDQRRDLEGSLLARGVGRSGEALRRRADLEADLLAARASADKQRVDALEGIDFDLVAEMVELAAERERQIAESRLRLLNDPDEKAPDVQTPGSTRPPSTPGGGSKSSGTKSSGSGTTSSGGGTRPSGSGTVKWSSTQDKQPKPATKPPPRTRLVLY